MDGAWSDTYQETEEKQERGSRGTRWSGRQTRSTFLHSPGAIKPGEKIRPDNHQDESSAAAESQGHAQGFVVLSCCPPNEQHSADRSVSREKESEGEEGRGRGGGEARIKKASAVGRTLRNIPAPRGLLQVGRRPRSRLVLQLPLESWGLPHLPRAGDRRLAPRQLCRWPRHGPQSPSGTQREGPRRTSGERAFFLCAPVPAGRPALSKSGGQPVRPPCLSPCPGPRPLVCNILSCH